LILGLVEKLVKQEGNNREAEIILTDKNLVNE